MADDAAHNIILYGKPDCHLCEIAYGLVLGLQSAYRLQVEKIDITCDKTLWERYHEQIPVLVIDGRTVLTPPIRTVDLCAALEAQVRP